MVVLPSSTHDAIFDHMKISLTIKFTFVFMMCTTLIKWSTTQAASKTSLMVTLQKKKRIKLMCFTKLI